jgi:hypothetical protein
MPQIIKEFDATFAAIDQPITLSIPRGSEELDLRVHRDGGPQLVIFVKMDVPDPLNPPANYERTFQLILADEILPASYKKYIATFPFGTAKIQVHMIEVVPVQEVQGFEIEQVG